MDVPSIYKILINVKNEILLDYHHLEGFECDGLSNNQARRMRGHGTVQLFTNGSKTHEWEQACAQLRKDCCVHLVLC